MMVKMIINKIIFSFILVIFLFLFPLPVFAHGTGLPPFFKINGQLAGMNPLQTIAVLISGFVPAQDTAPNYLVNEPISFEIDVHRLSTALPQEVLDKTTFHWEYGDGTTAEGLKNTHSYKRMGSYILSITADYGDATVPVQLVESVQLNILPDKKYILPQATIVVNELRSPHPLQDSLQVDLHRPIQFDASLSQSPSSDVVEYIWDFGDGHSLRGEKVTYTYTSPPFYTPVALQIKDRNGFISQTLVGLRNGVETGQKVFRPESDSTKYWGIGIIGFQLLALVICVVWYIRRRKKKSVL
jgi:hypothetical protein